MSIEPEMQDNLPIPPDLTDDTISPDQTEVGIPEMDTSHHRLLTELDGIVQANDLDFALWYPGLIATMEQDFRVEEDLMEACDLTNFKEHMEQHARMLAGLHACVSHVEAGELALGREAVTLLREWMPFHIATVDRELAQEVRTVRDTSLS